ncbi:MAG: PEP-CTERM sorting domain-containing protein [Halioglobus sp.]
MNVMRKLAALLVLAATSQTLVAMPMLSADGSLLSSVEVTGYGLYDIHFGDGTVGDVYASVTFDAQRLLEAEAVSAAMVAALNSIGGVTPDNIAGCTSIEQCVLFNPDQADSSAGFPALADENITNYSTVTQSWRVRTGSTISLRPSASVDNDPVRTLVTYTAQTPPSDVPVPATLALLSLGLAGLGMANQRRPKRS